MSVWTNTLNKLNNAKKVFKNGARSMFTYLVQPDNAIVSIMQSNGIAGFKFHLPQTEQVKFESEITDHYTDLNSAYQDNIALKPITITVTGLQGEYFYDLHPIENAVSTITTTISLVQQFLPKLQDAAIVKKIKQAKNEDIVKATGEQFNITATKDKSQLVWNFNAVKLWELFQNLFKLKSAQTRAFLYFKALWESRCRFSVETSWYRFDNMVIQSLVPMRDNNADITDFTITFKQIQFAEVFQQDIADMSRVELDKLPISKKAISKGDEVSVQN